MERRNKEEEKRSPVSFIYLPCLPIFLPYPHRPSPSIICFLSSYSPVGRRKSRKSTLVFSCRLWWSDPLLIYIIVWLWALRVTGRFFLPSFAPRSHSPLASFVPSFYLAPPGWHHLPNIPKPPPPGGKSLKWFSAPCHTVFNTYASESNSSISWSPQLWVGRRWRKMIISCKGTRSSVTSAYRNGKKKIPGNPSHEGDQSISREGLNRRKGEIEKMHLYLQPTRHIHKQGSNPSVEKGTWDELTRYVSHILIVHFTLISLINKQFIHLNANCINSTPCSSKCVASGASIRLISSDIRLTRRWIPGCWEM